MRLKRSLILTSILFVLTGCKDPSSRPYAWLCTFIKKDPLELSYSHCENFKSKEVVDINIKDMNNWISTDPDSYNAMSNYYKQQCK